MNRERKYYIAESGAVLEAANDFRKSYNLFRDECREFLHSCGAKRGQLNFSGRFFSLEFEGDAPEGFKKPNKHDCQEAYVKNKEWMQKLENGPTEPRAITFIKKVMDVVFCVNYENDKSKGSMRIGHFTEPVQVCFYSEDSPLLVILPDVERAVADKEADGYTVTSPKSHSTIDGLREILVEEWDLMVAKHTQAEEGAEK